MAKYPNSDAKTAAAANPYAPPQSAVADAVPATDGPQGIGGWLLLPVIGMFVFPIRALVSLATDYWPIFEKGIWATLTTPGTQAYHPLWAPVLVFEILFNIAFLAFELFLLYLLFTKSHRFPKMFIVFAVANLIFVVGDALIGNQIPAVAASGAESMAKEIGRSFIVVAIWVPYMLVSKRVKNTFKPTAA